MFKTFEMLGREAIKLIATCTLGIITIVLLGIGVILDKLPFLWATKLYCIVHILVLGNFRAAYKIYGFSDKVNEFNELIEQIAEQMKD